MIPVLMPVYARSEVAPVRGEGCWLFDADGRRYLDFASGIAVNCLGHGHPHLTRAIQEQAARLLHVSNLYASPHQEAVARRLVELTFADTVFFTNSGAEAIECAVKTCRRFHFAQGRPERFRILSFSNAFHGRTLTAIAATDQAKLRDGFEPLPDWFRVLPFGDLEAAAAAINSSVGGILVEPIQGEGGIRVAPPRFLQGLRQLCDAHGLLLLLDEVQCGVGRTGTLFAYEQFGIEPDVMAIAKGIGGGIPLGACLATERAAAGMTVGTHGSTYGGNPLAMAAASAVLDVVADPGFLAQVRARAERLRAALDRMVERSNLFTEVRGLGLMLGLKLAIDSRAFVAHLRTHGLLTVAAADNVVRLLPPLVIEDEHVALAVEALEKAAQDFPLCQAA